MLRGRCGHVAARRHAPAAHLGPRPARLQAAGHEGERHRQVQQGGVPHHVPQLQPHVLDDLQQVTRLSSVHHNL